MLWIITSAGCWTLGLLHFRAHKPLDMLRVISSILYVLFAVECFVQSDSSTLVQYLSMCSLSLQFTTIEGSLGMLAMFSEFQSAHTFVLTTLRISLLSSSHVH